MGISKKADLTTCINTVKNFLKQIFGENPEIVALVPLDSGWKATAELMLDAEYAKQFAKDNIIYLFEVVLDEHGIIKSYERVGTRKRGDEVHKE